jgi:hypothetical protein
MSPNEKGANREVSSTDLTRSSRKIAGRQSACPRSPRDGQLLGLGASDAAEDAPLPGDPFRRRATPQRAIELATIHRSNGGGAS